MKIYTPIKLNVSKLNVLKNVFAKQRDSNSRYLDCAFFDGNNKLLKVTGGDIAVNAMRADGTYRSFAGSINENGTVRVPLTNWMLDVAGTLSCSVTVYEGDEKLTTATFVLTVQPSENPTGTVSPDDPNVDLAEQLVERCEAAAEEIENKFEGSGVEGKSYTVIQDTITVETAEDEMYPYPVCQIASGNDILVERWKYFKVTLNDHVYILQEKMWYIEYASGSSSIVKGLGFIGNLDFYGREITDGYYLKIDDVPFLITSTSIDGQSEGIWLITNEAGTYTIKIERIEYDQTDIPDHLIYGDGKNQSLDLYVEGGYDSYNIGWNRYPSPKRGNIGIGVGNVLSGNFNKAFGQYNHVHGQHGFALGQKNDVSAQYAYAFGLLNVVSGLYGTAIGISNTASGLGAVADGYKAVASGKWSFSRGHETIANHKSQTAIGEYNEADDSQEPSTERGNYAEIVGNGISDSERSNARTLDWEGNESLAGGITLGKGTADEVTLSAAQLKRLIALLN